MKKMRCHQTCLKAPNLVWTSLVYQAERTSYFTNHRPWRKGWKLGLGRVFVTTEAWTSINSICRKWTVQSAITRSPISTPDNFIRKLKTYFTDRGTSVKWLFVLGAVFELSYLLTYNLSYNESTTGRSSGWSLSAKETCSIFIQIYTATKSYNEFEAQGDRKGDRLAGIIFRCRADCI